MYTQHTFEVLLASDASALTSSACRYTRGVYLRFPVSLMTKGRPFDFVNISQKSELLLAGYAVVSMDCRGTGIALQLLIGLQLSVKPQAIALLVFKGTITPSHLEGLCTCSLCMPYALMTEATECRGLVRAVATSMEPGGARGLSCSARLDARAAMV